ncbi:DegT/DnrJ/EryC1/StrS family aminotransferase [Bdellovibrio sp. HCB185ZH]|uniref:DegT/DnrJ/EryC1/StrS family aminotransferase n=1 Tax=Bdellovibrio sp. HCB185ZH TaxID=3394235 RepID=UPI0039A52D6A
MKVPVAKPALIGNEKQYVMECLETEWISSNGKYIAKFEEAFSQYIGVKHALTCSNGTVALHLPLLAMGIGPGDEVIVPTLTYIATANAVKYVGADAVFVDCEQDTWNICVKDVEAKITPKTKAIIVVHLYGHPVVMDPIMALAKKHNIYVIEDCAESLGATYSGLQTGSVGHVGTFSFFGNKTITTGEGGMVTTNDDGLAARMRLLKGQGMDPNRRYWHTVVGYNYRMTNIQAAIGLAQLENVEWHLTQRRRIAEKYSQEIEKRKLPVTIQKTSDNTTHSYWMFTVLLDKQDEKYRDLIISKMAELGVETRPIFYPMHLMPPHFVSKTFKNAEEIAAAGINLPTFSQLSDDQLDYVISTLEKVLN